MVTPFRYNSLHSHLGKHQILIAFTQFMDNFVANDEQGGKQAATALTYSIANLLKHQGYPVMPLTTRILGNPEWLSHAYLDAGVIPNQVNYGWFLQGFNSVDSLVEFVPVEEGPSVPAYRARGKLSSGRYE